ncbi:hypothetical protein ACIBHY_52515 [Nonomuraea sp. NPDC050547]|uniref:hypothetical protein n=1 Tax=Nonomuraea sp. NPDC050547 TaxID=3364368 RepID=UPI00379E6B70
MARTAENIDLNATPCVNRRAQHLIDLAYAHVCHNDVNAAVAALLASERHSSEPVTFNTAARSPIVELAEGYRRPPQGLLELAARVLKARV